MAKPGPKPKPGERYPSGDLKVAACRRAPAPAAVRRVVDAALRGAADPRFGTVVGRMLLEGALTSRQYGTAEAYGRLRGRFDHAMGLPRRSAQGVMLEMGRGGRGTDREMEPEVLERLRTDHARLLIVTGPARVLLVTGPARVLLDRVILDDEAPGPGELERLKAGLDRLAGWFGDGV